MLQTVKSGGFRILFRVGGGSGVDLPALFFALRAGTPERAGVASVRELAGSTTGAVFLVAMRDGRKLVFKHERREHHMFDHRVQSFLFGSNTERLIRDLDAEDRFGKIPAAEVLLVADRRKWGAVTESFLLTEFVEGEILGRLPHYREKYGNAVAALLARMHAAGIVHGDVHERNFVLRKKADAAGGEEVVAIDMSGKRATPFTRAEDRIRLEWTFGVKTRSTTGARKCFSRSGGFGISSGVCAASRSSAPEKKSAAGARGLLRKSPILPFFQ